MKTNRQFHFLSLLFLIGFLCFTNSVIGQNENKIIDILDEDGSSYPGTIKISLKNANDNASKDVEVKINDKLNSEATIDVKAPFITLVLKSYNGTIVEIPSKSILDYKISNKNEKYNLLKCEPSSKVKINKLKEFLGSVIATGMTNRLQALTYGTVFNLSLDDYDLNVQLDTGKLKLNHLIKREIKDENVLDNNGKRSLFIRENKTLTVKDGNYPSPDKKPDSLPILTDKKEIKRFIHKPFINQKRELISKGEFSKSAVKDLEKDNSKENAILSFDEAIENEEISLDYVAQSALLFADAYLFDDEIEKSKIWLEVGIHYSKKLLEEKQKIFEDALKSNNSEGNDIEKALTNALRFEVLTANEFSAWAFDIKLKLNGCLGNPSENPLKYRSNANNLLQEIEKVD